ncbi:hypothetical protein [Streptomyces sp. NPDC048603]|uniref:hypothetical protein n=1 Tax=Streptomyces sp. NPDC048603 TaxID=3365577 RepID=UPI0037247714
MKPISRTVRIAVAGLPPDSGCAFHPDRYEITDADEIREVLAVWPERGPDEAWFDCGCPCGNATLYEASGQVIRSLGSAVPPELVRLLDPSEPGSVPERHRMRWAAAAPEGLREYAARLARGERPDPASVRAVPRERVFRWLGAVHPHPADAARLLAEEAPVELLAAERSEELAWAVRGTDRTGLDGAVRFFASEHFTTRHPKRRRVPDTARDLLLRHARSHRPDVLPVLERRLLRVPEDLVRRS